MTHPLPATPQEISASWLSEALGRPIVSAQIELVIPGAASKVRVRLDDGSSVIVKAPLSGATQNAATLSFFAGEVDFYRELSSSLDVGAPRCLYAERTDDQAVVILEDLAGARFFKAGDTIDADTVARVLDVLARLHTTSAPLPVYPGTMRRILTGMLSGRYWSGCLERPRSASIPGPLREPGALLAVVQRLWELHAADDQHLIHGDAHIGNAYLTADGTVGLLDWQMTARGTWCHDVAYFVISALDPADRREHERDLLERYVQARGLNADDAWLAYRRHAIHGLYWATNADGMYPEAINTHMVERFSRAIQDLDSLAA